MATKSGEVSRRWFLGAGLGAGVVGAGLAGCDDGGSAGGNCTTDTDTGGDLEKLVIYPNQDSSEVRWGFLIDMNKCSGCKACSIACKTESDVRLGYFKNGVKTLEEGTYPSVERHFVPWLCNHCKNPTCIEACPTDLHKGSFTFPSGDTAEFWAKATYQRPDGLVLVDQDRCVGCGKCVKNCPYGARYLDPAKPAGGDPEDYDMTIDEPNACDKCNLCAHRLAQGVVPACVNTCPSEARLAGNLNDSSSAISVALTAAGTDVSALLEAVGTEPQVFYVNVNETAYQSGSDTKDEAGLQLETPDL